MILNLKQDGEVQAAAAKKQCGGGARKSKAKAAPAPTKDPQSVAAKVRREKIAEKLKVLQDLVPNGTKVQSIDYLLRYFSFLLSYVITRFLSCSPLILSKFTGS
jgi:hypothetical protein